MSNSLQVDKQPEVQQPGVQQPGVQQPGVQQPGVSNQESSNQEPSSSAATDLGQPRTWSSHGHGAATDLEQLQSRTC